MDTNTTFTILHNEIESKAIDVTEELLPNTIHAQNIWTYVSPILIILGTFGNVTTMVVLSRKAMWKMGSSPYLFVLAISDTVLLCSALLRHWLRYMTNFRVDIRLFSTISCKLTIFFVYLFPDYTAWILIAITVERFIAVSFPHKAKRICTRKRAWITLASMFIYFFLLNGHLLIGFGAKLTNSTESPVFVSMCSPLTEEYHVFFLHVWPWIDLAFYSVIPFTFLIICNVTLIVKLWRRRKQEGPKQPNVTALLISLNTTYLVTSLPISVLQVGHPFWAENASAEQEATLKLWWAVVNMFFFFNNSVNFLLYCVSGGQFRQELKTIFCRRNRVDATVIAQTRDTGLPSVPQDQH